MCRFVLTNRHNLVPYVHDYVTRHKKNTSPKFTSEIGRRGIRRSRMFIYNQIVTLNFPVDNSLPVFKYDFKSLRKHNQIHDDLMS